MEDRGFRGVDSRGRDRSVGWNAWVREGKERRGEECEEGEGEGVEERGGSERRA